MKILLPAKAAAPFTDRRKNSITHHFSERENDFHPPIETLPQRLREPTENGGFQSSSSIAGRGKTEAEEGVKALGVEIDKLGKKGKAQKSKQKALMGDF